MAKQYAFLFPGQGAQAPGMIKDVAESFPSARNVIDTVSSLIGLDMAQLLWESDAATLSRSDNSQIAITTASLAIMAALKDKGIEPAAAMGFSLGEFPALYAAGVLSFEDVIRVVRKRGLIMQEVCEEIASANEGHAPGMSAIIGLPPEKVTEIAANIPDAYAANMNSQKQTVISGTFDALTKAEEAAKAAGARAIRLKVAGPFHCPLMQKAADNFAKELENVSFADPKIPLFSNVTGKQAASGKDVKESAILHLTHRVRWTDEEAVLAQIIGSDNGNEWSVIEPGPGKVLTGLWKQTSFGESHPSVPVNTAEAINSL